MTPAGTVAVMALLTWLLFFWVRPAFLRGMVDARLAELYLLVLDVEDQVDAGSMPADSPVARYLIGLRSFASMDATIFPGPASLLVAMKLRKRGARGELPLDHPLVVKANRCIFDVIRYKSVIFWGLLKIGVALGLLDRGMGWMRSMLDVAPIQVRRAEPHAA